MVPVIRAFWQARLMAGFLLGSSMPAFRPRKAIAIGCCGEPGGEEAPFDRIDTRQYQPINMPAFWGDRPQ
jgi:hypothetical protein